MLIWWILKTPSHSCAASEEIFLTNGIMKDGIFGALDTEASLMLQYKKYCSSSNISLNCLFDSLWCFI